MNFLSSRPERPSHCFRTTARMLLCALLLTSCSTSSANPPTTTLQLPAKAIFAKGPNTWNGDVLEITRGRGATIAWYVQAERAEDVDLSIEYSCEKELNQAYQLSFDGHDQFWQVPPTEKDKWQTVKLGTYSLRPDVPVLIMLVPPSGTKYAHPFRLRKLVLKGTLADNLSLLTDLQEPLAPDASPGFGQKLQALHPALQAAELQTGEGTVRVSGMALRESHELLLTTWEGDLYSLNLNAASQDTAPPLRKIAQGLSEPMGLATLDQRIFVTEKNQATELIDADSDGMFETYRCVSHAWPCTLDYHEYLFGAVVQDGHLYFSASVAMNTRGTDNRQAALRGSVIKVQIDTGVTHVVAGGLRTPDGMGIGPHNSLLVTDNQGEWLPANKLIHVQQDAFYGFRSVEPWHPMDRPQVTPPAVWLPQGEIASSPTQPALLPQNWGPYAGQVVFGDATFGGLQRAVLEQVEGVTQGAVFPFSQGFRHLFHRLTFTPAGELYAGAIARGNDWDFINRVSGLTRIRYTNQPVFEPLAAHLYSNGLEIEFTEPLAMGSGWNPEGYYVSQWGYQATQTYGGMKVRHRRTTVRSATVSEDRLRVFLEIPELVTGEVLHVRLPESLPSTSGRPLWAGELWYTINRIPSDRRGKVITAKPQQLTSTTPFFRFSEGNAGRTLYRNLCASCHSFDSNRRVGPGFAGIMGAKRTVVDSATGQTRRIVADAAYLRQSILAPNAVLVEGYPPNLMPPVAGMLTESQTDALIDFLVKTSEPELARREAARQMTIVREWKLSDFDFPEEQPVGAETDAAAIERGRRVFLKTQCLQCHAVSGYGAKLGPDLAETVKKRRGQELLKNILEPSADLHPEYRTSQFVLTNGRIVVGNIIREDPDAFYVATNLLQPQELITVKKSDIEEQLFSLKSAMPPGLLNILTAAEIHDLLAWLEAGPAPLTAPAVSHPGK